MVRFLFIFIGLYTLITGERTISIILPGITEQVLIRIEYLLLYEAYILFAMYITSLLPGNAGPLNRALSRGLCRRRRLLSYLCRLKY